mmetsp:Transcript_12247/g.14075  ORF Transcript_12247/g.14075 Transcript_12247/m.14075 type:complete len:94 (+) Transcript_12247:34-315(+)
MYIVSYSELRARSRKLTPQHSLYNEATDVAVHQSELNDYVFLELHALALWSVDRHIEQRYCLFFLLAVTPAAEVLLLPPYCFIARKEGGGSKS